MANKKLTSSNILSLYNKAFSQKSIQVTVENQTFEVLIDEKFRPSKIQELIFELAEKQQQIKTLNDAFDISYYANFLIIKYFTNIELAKVDDLEKAIRVFKAIVDLGIFEQVINAFDEKEIQKINYYAKKMNEKVKELDKNPEAKKDLEEMMNDIENLNYPEVFLEDQKSE